MRPCPAIRRRDPRVASRRWIRPMDLSARRLSGGPGGGGATRRPASRRRRRRRPQKARNHDRRSTCRQPIGPGRRSRRGSDTRWARIRAGQHMSVAAEWRALASSSAASSSQARHWSGQPSALASPSSIVSREYRERWFSEMPTTRTCWRCAPDCAGSSAGASSRRRRRV